MTGLGELQVAGYIVAPVLGVTYIVVVGVALFHPDKERRADALKVLKTHRLTRKAIRKAHKP
jgi:hypothetical protein